jgi:hypothetical protein
MPRACLIVFSFLMLCQPLAAKAPVYVWLEPEWFDGVEGSFAYWTGTAKPTGSWGIAGPGISAEWAQGGESEWNSMGAFVDVVLHTQLPVASATEYTQPRDLPVHKGKDGAAAVRVRVHPGDVQVVYLEVRLQPRAKAPLSLARGVF